MNINLLFFGIWTNWSNQLTEGIISIFIWNYVKYQLKPVLALYTAVNDFMRQQLLEFWTL